MSGICSSDIGLRSNIGDAVLARRRRIYPPTLGVNRRRGDYRLESTAGSTAPGLAPCRSQALHTAPRPHSCRQPGMARASAPFTKSVTTLSRSAINRKTLEQRFGRISVSDQSHGWHECSAPPRASAALPGVLRLLAIYVILYEFSARQSALSLMPGSPDDPQGPRHRVEPHLLDLAHVLTVQLERHRPAGHQSQGGQIVARHHAPSARRLSPLCQHLA
jgi:hypothetical protein